MSDSKRSSALGAGPAELSSLLGASGSYRDSPVDPYLSLFMVLSDQFVRLFGRHGDAAQKETIGTVNVVPTLTLRKEPSHQKKTILERAPLLAQRCRL